MLLLTPGISATTTFSHASNSVAFSGRSRHLKAASPKKEGQVWVCVF